MPMPSIKPLAFKMLMISIYCQPLAGSDDPVVVQMKLGVRECFSRPFEGPYDPVPACGTRTAERIAERRRSMERLIHDIDESRIRITLTCGLDPLQHLSPLFVGRQIVDPARRLIAPNERVEFERNPVALRVVIDHIRVAPVHHVARCFYGAPLRSVFRRYLVPISAEVARDAARDDIAEKFAVTVRQSRCGRRCGEYQQ